ncbi:hypothetical protein TWF730_003440 [Orbilia blumenaviensis]|uniref:Uncharacterized protein n=1 Tax=Orbilia blumenaviensis TaxID=1796055 RepID=A0AAV9U6P3_9PEZI
MRPKYFLYIFALQLISPASSVPLTSAQNGTPTGTRLFPGDSFISTLIGNHVPSFATSIPLSGVSAETQKNLSLFRTATLTLNKSHLTDFLDNSRGFLYPVFERKRCQLGKDTDRVVPFYTSNALGAYFENIFHMIPAWTNNEISLSRFDLFHGHLFANPITKAVGVVFHSKEYPAQNDDTFPFNLGFCQINSDTVFSERTMRKRNLIWVIDAADRTSLWWIDMAIQTGNSAIDSILGGEPFYTLYESNFGHVIADFYFLKNLELGASLY